MQSREHAEPLDSFEMDVLVSSADNEAQWRARGLNGMDPQEYLRFLVAFTTNLTPSRETNKDSDEPFTL